MRGRSVRYSLGPRLAVMVRRAWFTLLAGVCLGHGAEPPAWRIPSREGEVRADGVLDEPQYAHAFHWDAFVETEPRENAQPSRRTEVFLFSNEKGLVVGIRAHDPRPEEIKRQRFRRDEAFGSERVEVFLDPHGEAKQGVFFIVTPMNDVMDGLYDLSSGNFQLSYDVLFHHGARVTDFGWECELFIPFSSLSFTPAKQTRFLMEVTRYVPRQDEEIYGWLPVNRSSEDPREGMAYVLVDTEGIAAARSWHFIPAWVGSKVTEKQATQAHSAQGSLGLTGQWQPRQDTLLKGTFRPDFSQVEADDTYQKINNRYPVFIREKRPFFLEGAESFATPIRLYYSRKIVQPEWGLKLSHRSEKLGLFGIVAQEKNVPAVRFGLSGGEKTTTWGVFRGTWALDEAGSFLGATATYRGFGGEHQNGVFSLDATKKGEKLFWNAQVAFSSTSHPKKPSVGSAAVFIVGYRWNQFWSTSGFWERVAPAFRADAGFVVKTDRETFQLQQNFSYKPRKEVGLIRGSNAYLAWRSERTTTGLLVEETVLGYADVTLPHQLRVYSSGRFGTEGVNGQEFPRTHAVSVGVMWDERPVLKPAAWALFGREVVYGASPWQGASQGWGASLSSSFGSFTGALAYDSYAFGSGARKQKAWQGSLTYVWSDEWSAKVFFVDEDLRFFDYLLAFRSRFINALLTYRVNPFSAVYLGANVALEREGELPQPFWDRTERQQVFVKVSWYF